MLRFIAKVLPTFADVTAFQYIPCYGLSFFFLVPELQQEYFNTSHVTVYHSFEAAQKSLQEYFNTSHVTVYHSVLTFALMPCLNFNTSHVTVYLMTFSDRPETVIHFNTSHVTVYLMILSHFYLGIFHHFLYFTSFQHFLPADYKI